MTDPTPMPRPSDPPGPPPHPAIDDPLSVAWLAFALVLLVSPLLAGALR